MIERSLPLATFHPTAASGLLVCGENRTNHLDHYLCVKLQAQRRLYDRSSAHNPRFIP